MPLTVTVPGREFFDQNANRFVTVKPTTLTLEHSLLSVSKWEAKWHKAYLTKDNKSEEEARDYIRCMCIGGNPDPNVLLALDRHSIQQIADYIANPMTATTFKKTNQRPSREIITNELIYFWMTTYGIPFDPCEKWHLNHLMTLIEVCAVKNQPSKKMSSKEAANQRAMLNARRRAKYHTRG